MDERLRRLERAWRERGDLEAGVALLRERERVGAITRGRLEVAAYLGHAPARAALGLPATAPGAGDRLPSHAFSRGVALPLSSAPEGVVLRAETLDDALTVLLRIDRSLHGEATWFPRALDELVAWGVPRLVLEFAQVPYVGSTNLGAIVRVADRLQQLGGGLALVGMSSRVRIVLEMLGLAAYLRLFDDVTAAVAALAGSTEREPEPRQWLVRLIRWGREPCVRAALLALEQEPAALLRDEVRAAESARDWLRCPCAQHRRRAREAAVRAGSGWAAVAATTAGVGTWPLGLAEGAPLRDEGAVRAGVVAWALSERAG